MSSIERQVFSQTYNLLWAHIWPNISAQTSSQVRELVLNQIYHRMRIQLDNQVSEEIKRHIRDLPVEKEKRSTYGFYTYHQIEAKETI